MTRVRWLGLVLLASAALPASCRRASLCPKGWQEQQVKAQVAAPGGQPSAGGYWCRRGDEAQYHQIHTDTRRIRQSCAYVRGKAQGAFKSWHPGGQRWVEGQYVAGQPHGAWTQWDERGNQTVDGEYREGRLVSGAPVAISSICQMALDAVGRQ